jgi:ABC-type multidrug transport system fused ATPase/permease subunit
MSDVLEKNPQKPRTGIRGSIRELLQYRFVTRLTGKTPVFLIMSCVVVGLLESILMTSVYPVIALGLGERTPKIDLWLSWTAKIGLNENQTVLAHLFLFLCLGVTCSAARWFGESRIMSYRNLLEKKARLLLAARLSSMQWNDFLKLGSYSSLSELSNSSERVADGAHDIVASISMFVTSAILIAALIFISPLFSALLAVLMLVGIFAQKFFGISNNSFSNNFRESHHKLGTQHSFLMQNFKYCRSTGYATHIISNMTHELSNSVLYFDLERNSLAKQRVLIEAVAFGAIASTLGVVYFLQPISFSQASIFLAVLYRLTPRAIAAFVSYQNARSLIPFLTEWLNTYNKAQSKNNFKGLSCAFEFREKISFEHVSYSFSQGRHAALKRISFAINPCTFSGIIGKSGSGKSTILDMISGLITADEGVAKIDGVSISSIRDLQKHIGIVHQNSTLIEGSILSNIAFMDDYPNRAWAIECARIANAEEFILGLPQGFDQLISTENSLSGGQAQRLCLARALYNKPSILLLDEPTSALDQESEQQFIESIAALKGRLTIIMATHRLSTLMKADQIIHLRDGRIESIELTKSQPTSRPA